MREGNVIEMKAYGTENGEIVIDREHAEELLEAARNFRKDIARGREYGWTEEETRENAESLEEAIQEASNALEADRRRSEAWDASVDSHTAIVGVRYSGGSTEHALEGPATRDLTSILSRGLYRVKKETEPRGNAEMAARKLIRALESANAPDTREHD